MTIVRGYLSDAKRCFGITTDGAMRLIAREVSIPEFRVLVSRRRWTEVEYDDAITSRGDLWDAICRHGWADADGVVDMIRYRNLRRSLATRAHAVPEDVIRAELKQNGPNLLSVRASNAFGGDPAATRVAVAYAASIEGRTAVQSARPKRPKPISPEEFASLHCPLLAELPDSCLHRGHRKTFPAPEGSWLGRAAASSHPDSVALLGLLALVGETAMSRISLKENVCLFERLEVQAGGASLCEPRVLAGAMHDLIVGGAFSLTDKGKLRALLNYRLAKASLLEWFDGLEAGVRERYRHLLLPDLPTDVAGWMPPDDDEVEAEDGLSRAERVTMRGEKVEAEAREVSLNRAEILSKVELRWAEHAQMELVVDDARREVEGKIARGEKVALPLRVAVSFRVVRPDATLADGTQCHLFEIDTAANLLRRVAAKTHVVAIDKRLSAKDRAAKDGGRATKDGVYHDPEDERRVRVVYVRTIPLSGGEHHPPFWERLFRTSALQRHQWLTPQMEKEGRSIAHALRMDEWLGEPGFLKFERKADAQLSAFCNQHLGLLVLPFEEFGHALAIGRALLRTELLGGLRIGEGLQARDDPGAFRAAKRGGRIVYYLSVILKGKVLKSKPLDPVTMASWTDVHRRVLNRWFDGREVRLPLLEYYDPKRKECRPAGYLARGPSRTVGNRSGNAFIRVLTVDIVDANSHAYKSGFGTMIAEAGATPLQSNAALNHVPRSTNTPGYQKFAEEALIEDLITTAQERAAAAALLFGFME